MKNKIIINLQNGDQLVAEECSFDGGQIAVGICHEGIWIQDLAVIETSNAEKYNVFVYENEYDECYTKKYEINRVPDDAI